MAEDTEGRTVDVKVRLTREGRGAEEAAEAVGKIGKGAQEAERRRLEEELRGQAGFLRGYSGSVRGAAAAPAPRREDYGRDFGAWNTARHEWARRTAPADAADRLARSADAALDTLRKVDAAALADALDRIRAESARIGREIERIKQRERNG